jgi:hypothetical protein
MSRTVAKPELTLMPVKEVPVQPEPASSASGNAQQPAPKAEPEKGPEVVDLRGTAKKSAIVLNAVNVAPDPHVQIPDAQLAGRFVVGPPVKAAVPALAPDATMAARVTRDGTTNKGDNPNGGHGSANVLDSSHIASTNAATTGPVNGRGTSIDPAKSAGSGLTINTGGSSPNGPGITISGGGSTSRGNVAPRINPLKRTYALTITGGGGSGGAGRDMGVFGRSEIVYSVAIPMSDVGCPVDWPMQYSLLNPGARGAGLLEPPVATKKVAAIASTKDLAQQTTPVFVRGVIDEKGTLVDLQPIVMQDPHAEIAVHALAKWEFLPAILDGTPVPSKVLIGVLVVTTEK